MKYAFVRAALALGCALSGAPVLAAPPGSDALSIRYTLLTSFAGPETANGRIVVDVVNYTSYALSEVTLRLSDEERGRVTGPLQEEFDLAGGESRRLEGDFVLPAAALAPGQTLEWLVVYSDADGFAQQQLVHGQTDLNAHSAAQTTPTAAASARKQRVD